jgi:hypothetical protein
MTVAELCGLPEGNFICHFRGKLIFVLCMRAGDLLDVAV